MSLLALLLEVVSRSTPLTLMGEERRPTWLLGGMDPSQEVGWNVDATGPADLEQFSDQLILADCRFLPTTRTHDADASKGSDPLDFLLMCQ